NRTVPFAGDYLWVSSVGDFAFATWTDWRNTVAGVDPREGPTSDGADVRQCRTFNPATGTWSGDQCPHAGGIDQNIYGSRALSFAKISPTPLRSKNRWLPAGGSQISGT